MGVATSIAILLAVSLDLTVREFPERIHPVVLYGIAVGTVDREWPRPRLLGLLIAVVFPLGGAVLVGAVVALGIQVQFWLGVGLAGLALFATTSLRLLLETAWDVIDATAEDAETARDGVRALVGRDTETLGGPELRSAAVESSAENLADGLVAPLVAFVLGATISLPVAAAATAWVKGVNTLDSMLGYHGKAHGWASARLDDGVMWLPARLTACLLALASGRPTALITARNWQQATESPNSGWPMATLAAALDCRLEKQGAYLLNPDAPLPTVEQARRAVWIVAAAGLLAVTVAVLFAAVDVGGTNLRPSRTLLLGQGVDRC